MAGDGAELVYTAGVLPALMSGGRYQRTMVQGHLPLYRKRACWASLHDNWDHVSGSEKFVYCAESIYEMAWS